MKRHLPSSIRWLGLCACLLLAPVRLAAEDVGHEFLPPEHWGYGALARFEALGLCVLPSEKPYSRDDAIRYVEAVRQAVEERRITLSPRDQFNLDRLDREFHDAESRANPKNRFDPPALYLSDDPMHFEADFDLAVAGQDALRGERWDFFGISNPTLRLHSNRLSCEVRYRIVMGPERDGNERNSKPTPRTKSWRGLTTLYERSYLVYHWDKVQVFFGRDYTDWGPAFDRNVLMSQQAGSQDKLGCRLRFKNFRLSSFHALLSVTEERYLAAHRLEMLFSGVTVGLSETVIHRERFLDPVYLIPFSSFYANQFAEREDDNVNWAIDLKVPVTRGIVVDGSLLIDDFQYERGDSTPDNLAFNVGIRTAIMDPLPIGLNLRYCRVNMYTYTHRDSLKAYVDGIGDPIAGDNILGVVEGPDTDLLTASVDFFPLARLTATVLFSSLRRGEGDDFRAFRPGDDHAPPFPSGVVERKTSLGLRLAWELDGNSLASAEVARARVKNNDHVRGADSWETAARFLLGWDF